jgi:glutamyl-tRNA reductase
MHPTVVGISHRTAPLELRERAALTREEGVLLGRELLAAGVAAEAVVLSTCNRTEVYLAGADARTVEACVLQRLACRAGVDVGALPTAAYCASGDAAVIQLFRVAASLDSMVVGEAQILAQVREAFEAAREAGNTGAVFNRLFRQAIEAGKRVRTETAIGERPVSVSSVAVELAHQVLGTLDDRVVLVLGAGDTSELTARCLLARGAGAVVIANRTLVAAELLAGRCHGRAVCLDQVDDQLEAADIVISSTAAPGYVIDRARLEAIMARRPRRPMLLIDLAVPRDIEPCVGALAGCHLCDIDDLRAVVAANRHEREREIAEAKRIVDEEVERLNDWIASRHVVPTIARLRGAVEDIRSAEVARMNGRLASLSPAQRDEVERLTVAIVNKILHLPTVRLKELAAEREAGACIDALWRLFDLDRTPLIDAESLPDRALLELPVAVRETAGAGPERDRPAPGPRPSRPDDPAPGPRDQEHGALRGA